MLGGVRWVGLGAGRRQGWMSDCTAALLCQSAFSCRREQAALSHAVEFQGLEVGMAACRQCCFLLLNRIHQSNRLINKTIGHLHTAAASGLPGTHRSSWWISNSTVLTFSGSSCAPNLQALPEGGFVWELGGVQTAMQSMECPLG